METLNFFVITGGPGVGKTTLINALGELGYLIVPEAARKIIKEQIQNDGEGLPWKNKIHYAQLMLVASLEAYQLTIDERSSNITFFDRGVLDTICYMKMENISIS